MNISLVMVTADGKSKELPPLRLPITIGRGEDCKLRIPLAAVSRKHAELAEDDDELVIRDLKSSNGTYVNKERIKTRELLPGDLLSVGPVVLVVRIDGHPKAVDPIIAWANGAVSVEGGDGAAGAIDGVPTWSSQQGAAPTQAPSAPSVPARPAAKPAPAKADTEESVDDILKDLSESDFDIDFGDDEPKKSK